ncbi:hypothetical protein [Nonomuraea lactucae]|uniref:hypothetical protein n=1 Tax=Nonomuraea lactucae TaxID=2249762 RepID=UPI0013B3C1EE|nr:hypothetical protein [Nonomuraea lactucae]
MAGDPVSYLDAWSLWSDGVDIRQRVLWGLEIYWWARYAKVAALVSGLILVIDIVGPERIERLLKKVEDNADTVEHQEGRQQYLARRFMARVAILASLGVLAALVEKYVPNGRRWSRLIMASWLVFVFLGVKDVLLRPILWVTNHSRALRVARMAALLLLVAAFHFDFLTT